jgi:hypothetical protein
MIPPMEPIVDEGDPTSCSASIRGPTHRSIDLHGSLGGRRPRCGASGLHLSGQRNELRGLRRGAAPHFHSLLRVEAPWDSVHGALGSFEHVGRQKARFQGAANPAARCAPEGGSATGPAKTLAAPAGRPRSEVSAAPRTAHGHWPPSRSRTPGPPPLFGSMNLTPACSSVSRNAFRMARRGCVASRSNCLRVTSPTSADRARSAWVQSSRARAARHWDGVIRENGLYHTYRFPSIMPLLS